MPAIIVARESGVSVVLGFKSMDDALRFRNFVHLFMDECGPMQHGFGVYWVDFDEKIDGCSQLPDHAVCRLDEELIVHMARSVLAGRLAIPCGKMNVGYRIFEGPEGIGFTIDNFPPPVRPSLGDRFFTPLRMLKPDDERWHQGVVVGEEGDQFKVVSYRDLTPDGRPKPDAATTLLSIEIMMKRPS